MDKNIISNLPAENIRLQRLKKKQEKLAELSGVTAKYINSIENGKVNPGFAAAVNICQALNFNNYLIF